MPGRKDRESDYTELMYLREIRDDARAQYKLDNEHYEKSEKQLTTLVQTAKQILDIVNANFGFTSDFTLSQLQGESFMAINGVAVGATGTFQIGFVPPNGVPLPSSPTVTVDDTNVTLSPVSTDGQFTFTAAVAATDTGASFNLTVAGTNAAGTALSHVFNVPIIQAPPPQITDFSLNQLS